MANTKTSAFDRTDAEIIEAALTDPDALPMFAEDIPREGPPVPVYIDRATLRGIADEGGDYVGRINDVLRAYLAGKVRDAA